MTTVFIISAPSGSGKSTLVNEVRQVVTGLDFSISYTTREPRGSEQNGREYFYVSRSQFQEMIRNGEFLEYAEVYGNNYYGTARRFLQQAEDNGKDLLLDIDVQGAEQIKQQIPQAISIFILPPDRLTLEKRLRSRSQDKEDDIHRRLVTASREIENYDKYDYILVNDRLEDSVMALRAILLAQRVRRSGVQPAAAETDSMSLAERCCLRNVRERLRPILDSFRKGDSAIGGA